MPCQFIVRLPEIMKIALRTVPRSLESLKNNVLMFLRKKDPRLMQFSSMRVDNWISSLPASTRFLLLATYIASKNPSHTDHVTMGVGLKGKRRKTIKGHTDKEDNDVETSILAQKGSLDVQKPIPLDRIFSM